MTQIDGQSTWTQDLRRHIHLQAVMACGVLADAQWHALARRADLLFLRARAVGGCCAATSCRRWAIRTAAGRSNAMRRAAPTTGAKPARAIPPRLGRLRQDATGQPSEGTEVSEPLLPPHGSLAMSASER